MMMIIKTLNILLSVFTQPSTFWFRSITLNCHDDDDNDHDDDHDDHHHDDDHDDDND